MIKIHKAKLERMELTSNENLILFNKDTLGEFAKRLYNSDDAFLCAFSFLYERPEPMKIRVWKSESGKGNDVIELYDREYKLIVARKWFHRMIYDKLNGIIDTEGKEEMREWAKQYISTY